MHNVRVSVLSGGLVGTIAQETVSRRAVRSCSKQVGERSVCMWFWKGGPCNEVHNSVHGSCWSWYMDISVNVISAFLSKEESKALASYYFLLNISSIWGVTEPKFGHLGLISQSFKRQVSADRKGAFIRQDDTWGDGGLVSRDQLKTFFSAFCFFSC